MSSILEALKKLEAEKAARLAGEEEATAEFVPERAAETLAPPPPPPGAQRHVPASTLLIGGILFALVLVVVSALVSLAIVRHSVKPAVVASAPPVPAQPAPQPQASKPEPAKPQSAPKPVEPPKPAPKPEKKVVLDPNPPDQQLPPLNVNIPEEKAPSVPVAPAGGAAEKNTAKEAAALKLPEIPAAKAPLEAIDIKKLPILKSSDRARYGLENMRLNVLREASESRPHGLAIINLNKVYIGEVIPGTRARLIDVKSYGIGIEMADTGERFYVQH
jgi:hypothetical protein